jgi:hypothetical protein
MRNEAKTCENFLLFVSQKEAKIMRNGLRFASILHVAKKEFKRKRDTLYFGPDPDELILLKTTQNEKKRF